MSNARLIQEHLDRAAQAGGYLDAINGTSPESLIDGQMKMHPLRAALGGLAVEPIVSVGIGQGEELHALRSVFGPETPIIGIDLSHAALERAQERADTHRLRYDLMEADACQLPFAPESLSAVVLSAIIHEVYSYNMPNGQQAYEASIAEAARTLRPGGVLYAREFCSPSQEEPVKLIPISEEAAEFYDYFTSVFDTGLETEDAGKHGINLDKDGQLQRTGDLTQILLHFRNFWNDRTKGLTEIGDKNWKELRESYVLPNQASTHFMDPNELCDDIVRISTEADTKLELVELSMKMRKKVNIFLAQHFRIENTKGDDSTNRLLHISTAKLEATFRKEQK